MQFGTIPGVSKQVSRIGQGAIMLGKMETDEAFALLDAVYEAGVNLFDSAHIYGGGQCDRVFGQWVRQRHLADKIVLMDKCCHPNADRVRVTPFDISADLHDCLARLKLDCIDIFAFHRDDESVPVAPLVERMNRHVAEGKMHAWGGSNWSHERLREAAEYAEANGLIGPAVSSPQYSLGNRVDDPWGGSITITGPDKEAARQWYQANQMPLIPWSSLCGGLFSGRFQRDNLDSFTDNLDKLCARCYCSEDNFRRLDRARELGADKGASPAQIALAYILNGPLNCFPLTAAWTPEQAADNAAAADIELTETEQAWLDLRSETRN